jgi:hypothetical protein
MIKIHVVQAEYGDSLILESAVGKNSTTILIDGGPYKTFEKHLKPTLQKLPMIENVPKIIKYRILLFEF